VNGTPTRLYLTYLRRQLDAVQGQLLLTTFGVHNATRNASIGSASA